MGAIVSLSDEAPEKGTFVVTVSFFDEADEAVSPVSVTWSLAGRDNAIVNSRENVVATPSAVLPIVLKGLDLDLADGAFRSMTVKATYDSSLGAGLPLNQEIRFSVENLQGID